MCNFRFLFFVDLNFMLVGIILTTKFIDKISNLQLLLGGVFMKSKSFLVQIFATIALVLCAQAVAFSDENPAVKDLRLELKSYAQKNVLSTLQQWKTQLDKSLSADDLKSLNALRSRAADFRKTQQDLRKQMFDAMKSGDKDNAKALREEMRGVGMDQMALAKELKPIAENNLPTLKSLGEKAKNEVEKWKSDVKSMVKSWWEKNKANFTDQQKMMMGKRMMAMGKFNTMMDGDKKKKMAAARFMLWDGSDFTTMLDNELPMNFGGMKNSFANDNSNDAFGEMSDNLDSFINDLSTNLDKNYPNPVEQATTIKFTLTQNEKVSLKLYDNAGNEVMTLVNGELGAGEHSVTLTTEKLTYGTYYYRLITPSNTVTKSLEIAK